jgi:phosphatidylserine/phosphatidylglycerophosphate/cardiolipin synthase-like enzyme
MLWLFPLFLALNGNSSEIGIYFSPHGGCESAIIDEVKNANSEILIAIYYFTDKKIADAVCMAKKKGVKIQVVLDKSQKTSRSSKVSMLMENNIPSRYDTRNGLMHNKFAVIDDRMVITGSFNWTQSAEQKNRENLIIIKSPEVASVYEKEFWKLWEASVNATGGVTRTEMIDMENKSIIKIMFGALALMGLIGISAGVVRKKKRRKK